MAKGKYEFSYATSLFILKVMGLSTATCKRKRMISSTEKSAAGGIFLKNFIFVSKKGEFYEYLPPRSHIY